MLFKALWNSLEYLYADMQRIYVYTVKSLLADTFLKQPLRLVPAAFSRIPDIKTLHKMDTSIRRTMDTYLWWLEDKISIRRTALINFS